MKQYVDQFKKLSISARLSLFIALLLFFTIGITINNALTRQEKRTHASSNNLPIDNTIPTLTPISANLSKDFHVYAVEWTSAYVSYLLDGVEQARITTNIPTASMYIDASIYPGGWLGDVQSDTPFPTYMYIDYVRLYQKNNAIPTSALTPTGSAADMLYDNRLTGRIPYYLYCC